LHGRSAVNFFSVVLPQCANRRPHGGKVRAAEAVKHSFGETKIMSRTRTAVAGLTLVELLVAVSIAAILAAVAVPSFAAFIDEQRLRAISTELVADINLARFEAIKRNTRVIVCPKAGQGQNYCDSNTKNWKHGWVVCYDTDQDGGCDAAATDDPNPFKTVNPLRNTIELKSSVSDVRFTPLGTATAAVSWDLSGNTSTVLRTITVAGTGNVTIKKK
jgi:prepilin-type N-terminal cleavage/methylation domain-containing protein